MTPKHVALPSLRSPFLQLMIVVGILLGSVILGGSKIGVDGFWHDEIASIKFMTDSAAWQRLYPEQMPAYFVVLRLWVGVVGISEVAGRWLSLLFGLLTMAITFRIVAQYFSKSAAAISIVLLGSFAFFVRYYREMRPYMLLVFLCTLSVWLFLHWLRTRDIRALGLYVVISVMAVYTHYFAGLVVAVHGIVFVCQNPDLLRLRLSRFHLLTLGMFMLVALSLIPYLRFYFLGLETVTSGRYSVYTLTPAQALSSTVATLTNDSPAIFIALIVLALSARPRGLLLVMMWVFFPLVSVLLVHTFIFKIFANPRYIIFVWPAFAIVAALGIITLDRRPRYVILAVLILVGVCQVATDLPQQQPGVLNNPAWREVITEIKKRSQPESQIIINMVDWVGLTSYRLPLDYYSEILLPSAIAKPVILELPPRPTDDDIAALAKKSSEIWMITTDGPPSERGNEATAVLRSNHYANCHTWTYPAKRTQLDYWGKVHGETISFANSIKLQRVLLNKVEDKLAAGTTLDLAIGLYATVPLARDLSLGVYLFDSSRNLVGQQDGAVADSQTSSWAPETRFCDWRSLIMPQTPGNYSIELAIYDPLTGTRIPLAVNPTGDNLVRLRSITIE